MASFSCSSSVSGHKISPKDNTDNRSKSCDTNCTSNSSCFFKRRKPMNPLAYSMRPVYHKTNNPVKQRVMSAKLLKLRQLQSQLNDANFHLAEVTRENQILKTLQKRQDKALSKYENTSADLPRLIRSHEEEIRVLTEKNRNMRKSVKELSEQLKQKEEELSKAREQLAHLEKLDKDKHLTEREKLTDKMEDYKIKVQKCEEQISTLNRKLLLESKASKQRLNAEIVRNKQCQKELAHAFDEIDRLTGLLDAKENMVRPRNPKFNKLQSKDSLSMSALKYYQHPTNGILSNEKLNPQTPVTEVKLEPIMNGKESEILNRKNQNGFKAPMENIRQRLSNGSLKILNDTNLSSSLSSDVSLDSRDSSAGSLKSRPPSSLKLEKLPSVQENQKIIAKMKREDSTKKERDADKQAELNQEASDNNSDREEYVQEKDVIVRYDSEKHQQLNENIRDNLTIHADTSQSSQTTSKASDPPKEEQTGDSSEDDLLDIIHRMKKDKQQEERLLHKQTSNKGISNQLPSTLKSSQSEKDFDEMAENLDIAIQKAAENSKEDFDNNLSNYCSDVLGSVRSCSKVIGIHKESLEHSKEDTNVLLDTLRKTEKTEKKLKKSFFNMGDDMDFVREILNEEHKFQMENKVQKSRKRDHNSNIQNNSMVNLESKKKLLATLRAIDNGDSVESIEEPKQGNIRTKMFSNIAH